MQIIVISTDINVCGVDGCDSRKEIFIFNSEPIFCNSFLDDNTDHKVHKQQLVQSDPLIPTDRYNDALTAIMFLDL